MSRVISIGSSSVFISDGNYSSKYPKNDDFLESGIPFISANNLRNGKVVWDNMKFISPQQHESLKKGHLKTGDVLLVTRGSLGTTAYVTKDFEDANINAQLVLLRADGKTIDKRYLYYVVSTDEFFRGVLGHASGTAQPQLPIGALKQIPLRLHEFQVQKKIAAILSAYDDLIENNTRRSQILEEMARRIYEEWFVHFRFPGHDNIRRVKKQESVPENWSINSIADFGNVVTGKTPSKRDSNNFGLDVPFLKLPDMHGRLFCIDTSEKLSNKGAASQSSKFIPANSLCVSCIGTAGIVNINAVECQTNQQINSLIPNNADDREYLYFALLRLKDLINQYGANGATMVNLNKTKFESLPVIQPTEKLVKNYHQVTYPLFQQILNLQRKNDVLRSTRDLLLPKLISGEIDVSNFPEPETD